jgi:hypothetical protein
MYHRHKLLELIRKLDVYELIAYIHMNAELTGKINCCEYPIAVQLTLYRRCLMA